jgi:hypothetical protein
MTKETIRVNWLLLEMLLHSAHAYNGIGAVVFDVPQENQPGILGTRRPTYRTIPCCAVGHLRRYKDEATRVKMPDFTPSDLVNADASLDIEFVELVKVNDEIVKAVNQRKGKKDWDAFITFDEWWEELNEQYDVELVETDVQE